MTTRRTPDEGLSAMTDHDAAPDADQELPAGPSRSRRLSASDTVLWDLDRDPVLRSTITAVAMLDRAPDWGRLRTRIDRASQLIPRMRQRVGPAPLGIGAPRWVDDGDFDLDHHLRRVRVPLPGRLRDVLDLVQPIASDSFDPVRPLWEFTLVEGMRGGGAALVQKLHHCLTDGVGGMELALLLLDDVRDQPEPDDLSLRLSPHLATPPAAQGLRRAARVPLAVSSAALTAATATLKDPLGTVTDVGELAGGVLRLLSPVRVTSPLMERRSLRRRFHSIDVSLDDLRSAGHAAGGTLNDAFMAAVVEGLRRYHRDHGTELEHLSITMPVSMRRTGDAVGGNRFTPARFAVPARAMPPIEQMRTIGAIAHSWQHSKALALTDAVAGALDVLPPPVVSAVMGSMLKGIDTVITNVPGLPSGCYLAGSEIVREYAMAPTSGAAVNVALVSVGETACIGVSVDLGAVPDDDVLLEKLVDGFRSITDVVGHQPLRRA